MISWRLVGNRPDSPHTSLQFARSISAWQDRCDVARASDLAKIGERRRADIVSRLVELGYKREDFAGVSWFTYHKQVARNIALSDNGRSRGPVSLPTGGSEFFPAAWRTIKTELCSLVDERLADRDVRQAGVKCWKRRDALSDLYEEWSAAAPSDERRFHLRVGDFWRLPSVYEVCNDVAGPEISKELWQELQPRIVKEMATWFNLAETHLVRLVLQARVEAHHDANLGPVPKVLSDEDTAKLDALADDSAARRFFLDNVACVFECTIDVDGLDRYTYPTILRHPCDGCDKNVPTRYMTDATTHDVGKSVVVEPFKLVPEDVKDWKSLRDLKAWPVAIKLFPQLMRAVGLDPATATRKDADALGEIWDCRLPGLIGGGMGCARHGFERFDFTGLSLHILHAHCCRIEPSVHDVLVWQDRTEPTLVGLLRAANPDFEENEPDVAACRLCWNVTPTSSSGPFDFNFINDGDYIDSLNSVAEVRRHLALVWVGSPCPKRAC